MRFRAELTGTGYSARSVAHAALLIALGSVLGLMESVMVPPLPVPGMKLGLANIAVVLAVVSIGPVRALVVSLLRVLVVSLATGLLGGPAMMLSLGGAIAAWAAMSLLSVESGGFSVVGIAVGGSSAHALGQLVTAVLVTGSAAPLLLMPYSLMMSILTGLIIGFLVRLLVSRLPLPEPTVAR